MRVKKERQPIDVICVDCGCTFTAYSRGALRCAERKLEHKRRTAATCMASYRRDKAQKTHKMKPKMTIKQVLREMARYNKANRTHLSYGQYVLLMDKGEIL